MPSGKEPSLAFIPTPNDALHSSMHSHDGYTNGGELSMTPHHSNDGVAVMSPSHVSFAKRSNSYTPQPSRKLSVNTNHRQSLPVGSMLPASATDGPEPSDEAFWFTLHLETLENFERERRTWRKMTERLQHDIDRLKAELDDAHASSRHDSAFYSMNGKENDKIFFNQNTVNKANEKLREFSVVSPRGTSPSPDRVSSPATTAQPNRKISSAMRLASISEDMTTPKRVSIAEPSVTDIIPDPETPAIPTGDNPLSPPPTARPMSPSPPSYIIDAGHTPRRGSVSNSLPTKRLRVRHNSVIPAAQEGFPEADDTIVDEIDDDPELHSPKILPTIPSRASSDMLAALNERLEHVASHPEENEPEAVKSTAVATETKDDESAVDAEEPSLPERGIRLKAGRSLNFGAQLGLLR